MSKPMSNKLTLGVLASGRGSNLQAIIDACEGKKIQARVGLVISDKEGAMALERARQSHLPAIFLNPKEYPTQEAYDQALVELLQQHQVDLVCLAGYMRILTPTFIEPFRGRITNIHPSLLPALPGLKAQRQAVEHGVKISGCTVHFVDEKVDQGPIIIQAAVPVFDQDTEESLAARILEEEHRIYPQAIQWYAEGRLKIVGRKVMLQGSAKDEAEESDPSALISPGLEEGLLRWTDR